MKRANLAFSLLIVVVAAASLERFAVRRYRANVTDAEIEGRTQYAAANRSDQAVPIARGAIELIEARLVDEPDDIRLRNMLAVNYSRLGRHEDAEIEYKRILEIFPVPDIYMNLALVQLILGRRDEALDNMVYACRAAPDKISLVDDYDLKKELFRRLGRRPPRRRTPEQIEELGQLRKQLNEGRKRAREAGEEFTDPNNLRERMREIWRRSQNESNQPGKANDQKKN